VKRLLQVLVIEDSADDAILLEIELQRAGYAPVCHRVETPAALTAALARQKWDLVLADYHLPDFDGLAALAIVKGQGLDVPFIIVSGYITEETAVAAMKAGAHDFVMKDKLARLGPAVERELRDAEVRRERRRSEEQLKAEHTFREAIENSVPSGIAVVDLEGQQTYVNPAFCAMVGWPEAELIGTGPPFSYWPPEEVERIAAALSQFVQGKAPAGGVELRFRRRHGERFDALIQVTPLRDAFDTVTGWVSSVLDISERKRAEARLAAEHSITRILATAQTFDEAVPAIVQVLLDSLEMDLGLLWIVDPQQPVLKPAVLCLRAPSPALNAFLEATRRLTFPPGPSLAGRVWQERRTTWVADLAQDAGFVQRDLAAQAGLHSAAAFPIQSAGALFGVLEFFTLRRLEPDLMVLNMMTAISSEIGQFMERRSAEEALRRAHDELEMRVQQRTADLKTANARLHAAIAERRRLEDELLEITEKERRRIGLDLHDDLGQQLAGLALMTKGLELKLAKRRARETSDAAKVHSLVQEAMNHAREVAHDLATLDLKGGDLPAALDGLAHHAVEMFQISCQFKAEGNLPSLDANIASQLYKIAQEAVTNAIKHAKAKTVGISLANGSDQIILTVHNDGLPFPNLEVPATGMGLRIMNYRASLIGAELDIKGDGPRGTRVVCAVPLEGKK
jgi:PAS domain S-box-containing protein